MADPVVFTASKFLGEITLKGRDWAETFDESRLPDKIAFYQQMHDLFGFQTTTYKSALDALEGVDMG